MQLLTEHKKCRNYQGSSLKTEQGDDFVSL